MKKSNIIAIVVALITLCGVIGAAVINLASPFSEKLAERLDDDTESTLAIRVANDSGQAIMGAKAMLFSSSGSLSQYTDSEGVSVFERIRGGDLRLIVEAQNYQIYEKQIQPGDYSIDVHLNERPLSSVDFILRAIQSFDGTPIPNVEIIIVVDGSVYRQTTDSDGFARYTLLASNEDDVVDAQISVDAKGYTIKNQIGTLTPGRLQYVMLTPDSLTIEIPDIPTPIIDVPLTLIPIGFFDEFDKPELDETTWEIVGPPAKIEGGIISLNSNLAVFPYVYAKQNPFPAQGNFVMDVSFRYATIATRGVGFVVDKAAPSPGANHDMEHAFLSIWQDAQHPLSVYFRGIRVFVASGRDDTHHIVELRYSGKYYVSVDGNLIYISPLLDERPSTLWFGNPVNAKSNGKWTGLEVDYIRIKSIP